MLTVSENFHETIRSKFLPILQKLSVPDNSNGLSTTAPEKRGWVINPLGVKEPLPVWAYFLAVVPALLIYILIFMENQITR